MTTGFWTRILTLLACADTLHMNGHISQSKLCNKEISVAPGGN